MSFIEDLNALEINLSNTKLILSSSIEKTVDLLKKLESNILNHFQTLCKQIIQLFKEEFLTVLLFQKHMEVLNRMEIEKQKTLKNLKCFNLNLSFESKFQCSITPLPRDSSSFTEYQQFILNKVKNGSTNSNLNISVANIFKIENTDISTKFQVITLVTFIYITV
jgi:hypothetical protein